MGVEMGVVGVPGGAVERGGAGVRWWSGVGRGDVGCGGRCGAGRWGGAGWGWVGLGGLGRVGWGRCHSDALPYRW